MSRIILFVLCMLAALPAVADLRLKATLIRRSDGTMRLSGKSYSSELELDRLLPATYLHDKSDDLGYGDRYFLDGYVCMDPGTGNPNSPLPDSTWYWGYQDAAQYDAETQTLSFTSSKVMEQQLVDDLSLHVGREQRSFSAEALGLELAGGYVLGQWGGTEVSLELGWLWLPNQQRKLSTHGVNGSFWLRQGLRELQQRYVYATYGTELPPPGHAGTYEGPFDQPPQETNVLIHNRPERIETIGQGNFEPQKEERFFLRNRVQYKIDWQEQELHLALQFRKQLWRNLDCLLAPRLGLRYVRCDVKRRENLIQERKQGKQMLRQWRDSDSGSRLMPGLGLAAALEKQFDNGFFTGFQLALNCYPQQVKFRAGPASLSLRHTTLDCGAVIGFRF